MNTLYFKYAVEVERLGSITQAADNLYMAQPNLSKAIKELEDSLGISIFKRTSKGVIPTGKGAEFLRYAKNILAQMDKIEALNTSEESGKQCINISIPHGSYIAKGLTSFVSELDQDKEIVINIKETNSMEAINNIIYDKFDLGIIRYQCIYENYFFNYLAEKDFSYDLIWEYEYLAVMSKNHPLASLKDIHYGELSKFMEITHGDISVPYITGGDTKKIKEPNPLKKRIYVYERCSQFDLLSHIPTTFMWVSPIPEDLLERYGLIQRKCYVPNHQYKDVLIYPKGYKFTPLDKKLIDKIYEAKNEVAFREYC
ncbi:LysR family transcriptional regulator [Anaerocolumna sedimenticola]|uniref:LysR family transcriptional regulator n=1 Tax=Anaerocolumna sedimenticola TaxID=2696063 RepID=A0A6P1TRP2_9FIRM|nr:LysR family transcriptional regulator [Anaerocolumna sedimenticola]QHQ63133.1 LysR family transcriptional regulator [Anaerocolumna sedimenticola]